MKEEKFLSFPIGKLSSECILGPQKHKEKFMYVDISMCSDRTNTFEYF